MLYVIITVAIIIWNIRRSISARYFTTITLATTLQQCFPVIMYIFYLNKTNACHNAYTYTSLLYRQVFRYIFCLRGDVH